MPLFKNHPKSLWVIVFGEMWNAFSYYGTQTILVLYMMHVFNLSRNNSYLLYGAYAAFAFTMPMLGGIIADKWLGNKHSLILGALLNIIGNIALVSLHRYLFSFGLATSLIGSGFYKSNTSSFVGSLYTNGDAKKETAYTIYYLATNVGGVLAPILYGGIIYFLGWRFIFLFNVLAITIALGYFITYSKYWVIPLSQKIVALQYAKLLLGGALLFLILIISFLFYFLNLLNWIIILFFSASIIYILVTVYHHNDTKRKHLSALLCLSFFTTFYYAAALQVGTTITLFIQQKIEAGFITFKFPASTFSMLYCLFILLLAPLFTTCWHRLKNRNIQLNPMQKLSIGILCAASAILIFALAAIFSKGQILFISTIVIGYIFLSAGELILAPAIYTAISDLTPVGMKSTMMGCWLLFVALGGYLSGLLANTAHYVADKLPLSHSEFFSEFIYIAIFTLIIAVLAFLTTPKLSNMMK